MIRKHFIYLLLQLILLSASIFAAKNEGVLHPHKTIFITGGAGFIGSNFLEYMFDKYPNYHFVVLDALTYAGSEENISKNIRDSSRLKFIHGSIVDFSLVNEIMSTADFVVHFAAETHVTKSIDDGYVFYDTNVIGTYSMMAALVKQAKTVGRFIHISTSEVYGTAEYEPMDENHPLKPKTPYASSKAGADRLVHSYGCTFDIPVVIIRPFNNYGPKQHREKMIANFITSAIEKKPLTIHGDGQQLRDWVYVSDVAAAIDQSLHIADFSTIKNQEINLGTGKARSVLEIAKLILKHFNLPETFLTFVEDRPGQVQKHLSSTEKSRSLLDWSPSIDFENGLRKTIEWYHLQKKD